MKRKSCNKEQTFLGFLFDQLLRHIIYKVNCSPDGTVHVGMCMFGIAEMFSFPPKIHQERLS